MINYNGLTELFDLWENMGDEGQAVVDEILNSIFPGTKKYHVFGHDYIFTDFSEIWSVHYLLAMVKEGMIEVPKEKLMHRTHENPEGLIWEDDFILIPRCGEIYIPGDARIIE